MGSHKLSVELIQSGSPNYHQACSLGYRLFYAEHNLPWDTFRDERDCDYFHFAITSQNNVNVLAYAQLVPQENLIYLVR